MGGIFISYRREDSGPYAGRLRDALSRHFGAEQVFRDIDRINPGERFPRVIEQAVGSCDALLAIIGPAWVAVRDEAGRRRLDNPDDYVRHEIATGLDRSDVLVIPVLVGSTSMPAAADLPKPLAALAECNAVRITDESWDDQLARLIRALEKVVKPRVVAPPPFDLAEAQAEVSAAGTSNAAMTEIDAVLPRESDHPEPDPRTPALGPAGRWLPGWLHGRRPIVVAATALVVAVGAVAALLILGRNQGDVKNWFAGVPGADAQGFKDFPQARCVSEDQAVFILQTSHSMVVICRSGVSLYYRGMRMGDKDGIELDNVVAATVGGEVEYVVTNPNDGTRYEVRPNGLTIMVKGKERYFEEEVEHAAA